MSYYKAICPTVAGFGGPSDVLGELSWPIDWVDVADMPAENGPLELTRARAIEWFWRFRELDHELNLTDGTYTYNISGLANGYLIRDEQNAGGTPIIDEAQLGKPGISETFGVTGAGPAGPFWYTASIEIEDEPVAGGVLQAAIQISIFNKALAGSPSFQVPHMAFNPANQLWVPSIRISYLLDVDNGIGGAWQHTITSYTDGLIVPDFNFDCPFMASHGGGDIPMNIESSIGAPAISSASLTVGPKRWFRWGSRWDEDTGDRVVVPA
jgi:hypothetical protein